MWQKVYKLAKGIPEQCRILYLLESDYGEKENIKVRDIQKTAQFTLNNGLLQYFYNNKQGF